VRVLTDSLPSLGRLGQLLLDLSDPLLNTLGEELGDFGALHGELDAQLSPDPPYKPADGGTIRDGADELVDELRELARGGRQWFNNYEQEQRERTGIRTLKVKSTGAFGYFIEVSKANLSLVPGGYTRKQTLVNSERFVTPELQEYERKVAEAEGRLSARETELFEGICVKIDAEQERLARAARAMARADVLLALAEAAAKYRWVRPQLSTADGEELLELEVEDARHPLVEQAVGERYYTKNDVYLSAESQQVLLLTGPNMGGKSTYLRMAAVLC
jgi:DNA mismatch repair protein MutS